jgi:hypothetical protein
MHDRVRGQVGLRFQTVDKESEPVEVEMTNPSEGNHRPVSGNDDNVVELGDRHPPLQDMSITASLERINAAWQRHVGQWNQTRGG